MKSHYRAVVIGGGVVGASVLYHLTRFGWSDVALIERAELTAGSTWHAAAGFHALNADPNVAALQDYTIKLYREIEAESGQNAGLHMTGGVNMASDPQRWEWLKSAWAVFQSVGIETARLMTPEEIKEICPIVDVSDVLGGLYDSNEGHLDPYGTTHAYAGAAKKRGADVILRNRVVELKQRADGGWDVVTEKGTIVAEHVVNAGGLWAKQVGLMAGVDLPVTPMEHHYFVTEDIPEIAALDKELGLAVDLDGFSYLRQERKGVLLGVYEQNPKHWNMDGAPWDYGIELIPEDIDRISPELSKAYQRFPCLAKAGIRKWVNGAFTFTPDGNPLVGPVRGLSNYWVACGVMAGFSQGGGVGKSLAEWMIYGEPQADIFGMDIARYGAFAANREYLKQTTGQFYARRFVMTFPNERLPAGRPLKRPGAYDGMSAAGAEWTASWGLEIPAYFAPMGFREETTLKRSNAFDIVGDEVLQVRRAAGLVDTTAFSRHAVSGPGAEAWLDRLLACRLPKPGRAKLAPMLGHDGRLKGDLTVLNWGGGDYWIMGSYYLREFHMRWFEAHLAEGVSVTDRTQCPASSSPDRTQGRSSNAPPIRTSPPKPCRSWLAARSTSAWCAPASPGCRSPASSASRSTVRPPCMRPCARRCWSPARISASPRSAITRSIRCGWKRASASGRANSRKATRPARPGSTASSPSTRAISLDAKRRSRSARPVSRDGSRRWRSIRSTPTPAASSRSGTRDAASASSPPAAMATQSARASPWRCWMTISPRRGRSFPYTLSASNGRRASSRYRLTTPRARQCGNRED